MIRKSFTLLALALVAAAVAAPLAQSSSPPKVDPLAVGFLAGYGLTPSEVTSWIAGACSHRVKDSSCYAMLDHPSVATASRKVDPLAAGLLAGYGLSPSEVSSWTAGACSHQVKDSSCYAMLDPASIAAASTQVAKPIGFKWGDAAIGAGATLGIVLLLGGAGAGLLLSRQNRRRQMARA